MTSLPYHSPTSFRSQSDSASVVVDASSIVNVQEFMHWIGSCPRPSGIRVYIPPIAHRASMQRLQRSLLSMGCTVTCRIASPSRL